MYQIVKFTFPFASDFEKGKPRPSLVLSPAFGTYKQIILAYITTKLDDQIETDIFVDSTKPYFPKTGLRISSLLKIHRVITVTPKDIGPTIGNLPEELISEVQIKLKKVFVLK